MARLTSLIAELGEIQAAMARIDHECATYLNAIPDDQKASARNLLHYLALRRHDLRHAQPLLASHGLSSLGRTESHVRDSLETVLGVLYALEGASWEGALDTTPLTKDAGEVLLAAHTDALLGPAPDGRTVRIMVTMPGEAATDYALIRDLVAAGMDCMRINCAHDNAAIWARMIDHLRRANGELRRTCRLSMDIAGPKLRTGTLTPGPSVLKIKPHRDAVGRVVRPAIVALVAASRGRHVPLPVDAVLTLDSDPPSDLEPDDIVEFDDARGKARCLRVCAREGAVAVGELQRTAYVMPATVCRFKTASGTTTRRVVNVPPLEEKLLLRKGDTLLLTPESGRGRPAIVDDQDRVLMPASIGITLPEVFRDVRPGEAVWFDDGKIGGMVRAADEEQITVEITQAGPAGSRLGAGKGVNLPDTHLRLSPLTSKDLDDLPFVARHADLIGYSFVRHAEDIHQLQHRLADLKAEQLGIILKIETRHAFAELPKLLLACMRRGRFGVMIARGDLAVECGFERMAEVQEEILWICEAAHTPVVWATQVLESLAKTGMPSRAEVTDAAMSERAECVMLNKGPFIREAVRTLDDILRRMQTHQTKKRAMLRPLQLAHAVLSDLSADHTTVASP
jgi:pyruvate kinase